jgi:hypothetical protein
VEWGMFQNEEMSIKSSWVESSRVGDVSQWTGVNEIELSGTESS